jgi:DNA-binding IclR family transcriptional regulator
MTNPSAPAAAAPLTTGAQTLRRGLEILRLLTRVGPDGLHLTEIARGLGFNRPAATRLTRTLVEEGFVVYELRSRTYRLGPEAFAVGLAAEPRYELQRMAAPTLKALAKETGDTVFFMVFHGYESICLSRDEGHFRIRNQLIKPGDRWPLGVGAGACAMLAAMPDQEVAKVLALNAPLRARRFPKCTDDTIWRLIRETRERGFCVQPGLVLPDSWAVGVVVYDPQHRPVASISVAAIRSRLGVARSSQVGNRLMQASEALSQLAIASTPE